MKFLQMISAILITQVVGVIGSSFNSPDAMIWYKGIMKSVLTPPSWVFGPVWIILYTFMGFAAYLVWQKRDLLKAKLALVVYAVHLVFNALWSVLFFGMKSPGLAFIDIIFLEIFIILTVVLFWRINKWAGILFLPYFAWVSFALYLNLVIWQLN